MAIGHIYGMIPWITVLHLNLDFLGYLCERHTRQVLAVFGWTFPRKAESNKVHKQIIGKLAFLLLKKKIAMFV